MWVSIKEEWPKESGHYLICYMHGRKKNVCEAQYNNGEFSEPYYGQDLYQGFDKVTHWQTLPEPPKD